MGGGPGSNSKTLIANPLFYSLTADKVKKGGFAPTKSHAANLNHEHISEGYYLGLVWCVADKHLLSSLSL